MSLALDNGDFYINFPPVRPARKMPADGVYGDVWGIVKMAGSHGVTVMIDYYDREVERVFTFDQPASSVQWLEWRSASGTAWPSTWWGARWAER